MHPAIKIISLVIVSIFLTQGGWLTILITGALLLPFYLPFNIPYKKVQGGLWPPAIKMLLRLKWFFISIFVIYYFYTPQLQIPEQSYLNSKLSQLLPGLFRITVLIFILLSVNLFIQTTSKEKILAALLWLFSPLKILHIKTERIALRAVLTLEYIEDLSRRLSEYKKQSNLDIESKKVPVTIRSADSFDFYLQAKKQAFLHLIKHSGIILREILEEANSTAGRAYTIDGLESPRPIQYVFPLLIYIVYHFSF